MPIEGVLAQSGREDVIGMSGLLRKRERKFPQSKGRKSHGRSSRREKKTNTCPYTDDA